MLSFAKKKKKKKNNKGKKYIHIVCKHLYYIWEAGAQESGNIVIPRRTGRTHVYLLNFEPHEYNSYF